jgi:hypothetical protein
MIQSPFPINFREDLLASIQTTVTTFLDEQERGKVTSSLNLPGKETIGLAESVNDQASFLNPSSAQLEGTPVRQLIQARFDKITAWKSKFHDLVPSSRSSDIVSSADHMSVELREKPVWQQVQENLNTISLWRGNERECFPLDSTFEGVDSLQLSASSFAQDQAIISQQVDQALISAKQQDLEWDRSLQELSLLKGKVGDLSRESQSLSDEVHSLSQEVQVYSDEAQRLNQQELSIQGSLVEAIQKVNDLEKILISEANDLSDLQSNSEALDARLENVEEGLTHIRSEQHEAMKQLANIEELEERILLSQEASRAGINRIPQPLVVDSLQEESLKASPNSDLSVGLITNVSNVQKQVHQWPSYIRDTITESVRDASMFLWKNFTNVVWETIEVISIIGRQILQYSIIVCSYAHKKAEVWIDRDNPLLLVALGALSGQIFVTSGIPFIFGATAIVGYLFIRKIF